MASRTTELQSDDVKIEQKPAIVLVPPKKRGEKTKKTVRESDVVKAGEDVLKDKDYLDKLAFMEQPVTVRLEPSNEKNAATVFPIWVNGTGCEVYFDTVSGKSIHPEDGKGRWLQCAYVPVDEELTIKRKYLEVIIRAKIDTVQTQVIEHPGLDPENRVSRFTSPIHSFSILYDPDPRGPDWVKSIRRKNH